MKTNFYSIDAADFNAFDPFGDDLGYSARFTGNREDDDCGVELIDNETGDAILYF